MAKKLSLLLAAVAVLAFAVPAFASAATGLTEGGALVPAGKIITGTNVGESIITSSKTGNIICENEAVMVEAKLAVNTSSLVEAVEGGNAFTAACKTASGGTTIVKNIKLTKLTTTGGGSGKATFSFETELGTLTCKYSATEDTWTYSPGETTGGGNVTSFSEAPLKVTPTSCGTTAKYDGEFRLNTQASTTKVFLM